MKARLIASLVIALMLVAVLALPAMADESGTVTASVTVTEYKSITITDEAPTGITFGSLNPDTSDNPDLTTTPMDASHPSVTVSVDSGTNVVVDLKVSGTDFSGTFAVSNAKYSLTYVGAKTAMSTTPTEFAADVSAGGSQMVWHWRAPRG